jgi:hypothetical protein
MTVYEKCVHGKLEKHADPAWPVLNDETGEWGPMCPGGKEITLQQIYGKWEPENVKSLKVWVEADDETV